MSENQLLETLSVQFLNDDRILSPREKDLLASLLQRARSSTNGCRDAMIEMIAGTVGEMVAARTYETLGNSIAQRLLDGRSSFSSLQKMRLGTPTPPGPGPGPIAPQPPGPNPPHISRSQQALRMGTPTPPGPGPGPIAPQPPGPNPPGVSRVQEPNRADAAVGLAELFSESEPAEFLPADCVILDEFLTASELRDLTQYTLQQEMAFKLSEVISPGVTSGAVDCERRRSRVLMDLGKHEAVMVERLRSAMPWILRKLRRAEFDITRVEAQITASNDGDFFRWHCDNSHEEIARREITFVYFFHREPKPFCGGELRIYDSRWENGGYVPTQNYRTIVPERNQLVLFASSLAHEITAVETPSRAFIDSRFTVNGWFHR